MDDHYHEGAHRTLLTGRRLIIVTGKGGVGKTTIAAALARAWARAGEKTLLTSQSRDVIGALFGKATDYQPVRVDEALWISHLDAHSALKEYAHRHAVLPSLYDWFLDNTALRQFTEAAPGFEELMCLGKLYELVTSAQYDRVVFDAPATGHAALMLRVPRVIAKAVTVGQLHHNALKIQLMLESDVQTAVVTVALPEEMAVREAIELRATLQREANLQPGPVVLNRLRRQLFSAAEVSSLQAIAAPGVALSRVIDAARARFELSSAQAVHVATLGQRVEGMTFVPEIIRERHEPMALLDAVGKSLAPLAGTPW